MIVLLLSPTGELMYQNSEVSLETVGAVVVVVEVVVVTAATLDGKKRC